MRRPSSLKANRFLSLVATMCLRSSSVSETPWLLHSPKRSIPGQSAAHTPHSARDRKSAAPVTGEETRDSRRQQSAPVPSVLPGDTGLWFRYSSFVSVLFTHSIDSVTITLCQVEI